MEGNKAGAQVLGNVFFFASVILKQIVVLLFGAFADGDGGSRVVAGLGRGTKRIYVIIVIALYYWIIHRNPACMCISVLTFM